MDAFSLRCPSCGAAAEPAAGRCAYCQARLATVSCPQCFALIFDGAAFCPSCGAGRARAESGTGTGKCPGCRAELQPVSIGATALLECPACDGVWLTSDEFERICANREAQAAVLHRWSGAPHAAAAGQVRYRPCVQCGTMMNRVNFGRLSGTIVDVCRGHGTFLDSGELHAIVAFVQGGGLDRMRARDIADLRDEQRRLREAQAATMRRSREDPPSALKVLDWTTGDLFSIIDLLKKD